MLRKWPDQKKKKKRESAFAKKHQGKKSKKWSHSLLWTLGAQGMAAILPPSWAGNQHFVETTSKSENFRDTATPHPGDSLPERSLCDRMNVLAQANLTRFETRFSVTYSWKCQEILTRHAPLYCTSLCFLIWFLSYIKGWAVKSIA